MNYEIYRLSRSMFEFVKLRYKHDSLKETIEFGNLQELNTSYYKNLNSKFFIKEIVKKLKYNDSIESFGVGKYKYKCVKFLEFNNKLFILTYDFNTIAKVSSKNIEFYDEFLRFLEIFVKKGEFNFLKIGEKKTFYLRAYDYSSHFNLSLDFNF